MNDQFKTSAKRHSSDVTDSLSQNQRSDSILILNSIDRITVLLKKQERETDIPSVLSTIYKIALVQEEGGRVADLPSVLSTIYKIALVQEEGGRVADLPSVLSTIYKIALVQEEGGRVADLPSVLSTIYKIALVQEEGGRVADLPSVLSTIYKIALVQEEGGRVADLPSVLSTIYKIALVQEEGGRVADLPSVLSTIYKIALVQEEGGRVADLPSVLNIIYRVAFVLQKYNKGTDLLILLNSAYRIVFSLKESVAKLWDILFSYLEGVRGVFQSQYLTKAQREILDGLEDATSYGQLESKKWLLEILKEKNHTSLGTVFVCAGWYGLLPMFFLSDKDFSIQRMFLFDKDPLSVKVSEDLNRSYVRADWKFKATKKDILSLNYKMASFETLKANGQLELLKITPDTIINTSCEHIKDFSLWWSKIPEDKLVVLQSNDYFDIPFHVNCHSSLAEFKKAAPMKRLIYEGVLDLKAYRRFLLIGFK